jgi:ABC-2 type transport system permease protein
MGYRAMVDSLVLSGRTVRHILRNPEQAIVVVLLPAVLLLLFRYMFGGAISVGEGSYVNYIVPGVIAISVTFNATTTTVGVCADMTEGIVDRFRSMPMLSTAVLTGHVVGAVVRNAVSIAVIIVLGLVVGFRPSAGAGGWVAALGLLLLFVVAIGWLSVILGLLADSVEAAGGLSFVLVFIPYASSAFVPPSTMPPVLRVIVENQPVTPVIDAVRALLLGAPVGDDGWIAMIWWVSVLVIAVPVAGWLFRRRTVG